MASTSATSYTTAAAAAAAMDVPSPPPVFHPGPGDPYTRTTDLQLKTTFEISGAAKNLRTLYELSKVSA